MLLASCAVSSTKKAICSASMLVFICCCTIKGKCSLSMSVATLSSLSTSMGYCNSLGLGNSISLPSLPAAFLRSFTTSCSATAKGRAVIDTLPQLACLIPLKPSCVATADAHPLVGNNKAGINKYPKHRIGLNAIS